MIYCKDPFPEGLAKTWLVPQCFFCRIHGSTPLLCIIVLLLCLDPILKLILRYDLYHPLHPGVHQTAILCTGDQVFARRLGIKPEIGHPPGHHILLDPKVRDEEAVHHILTGHPDHNRRPCRDPQFIEGLNPLRVYKAPAPHGAFDFHLIGILRHSPVFVKECPPLRRQIKVIRHKDKGGDNGPSNGRGRREPRRVTLLSWVTTSVPYQKVDGYDGKDDPYDRDIDQHLFKKVIPSAWDIRDLSRTTPLYICKCLIHDPASFLFLKTKMGTTMEEIPNSREPSPMKMGMLTVYLPSLKLKL